MSNPSPDPTYVPPNPREARRPFGTQIRASFTLVTFLLIGGSVAVALLSRLGEDRAKLLPLFISLSPFHPEAATQTFLPEVLRGGQIWRLLTPMFIHYGGMHLIFNMLMLRDLGGVLERRYGEWRFVALVLGLQLVSGLTQYLVGSPFFGGMSGVLYGLFGFAWVQGRLNPVGLGFVLTQQTVLILMGWFVLCFTGFLGPIANGAHAGGLVAGAAISYVVARLTAGDVMKRRQDFREAVSQAEDEPLHRCHTCGRTEKTAPEMEFRVSSVDSEEYCTEHLPTKPA